MKESEALDNVRLMVFALQKFRSVTVEEIPDLTQKIKEDLMPWVYGPQCPLEAMTKVIDGGQMEPQTYYNFTYIMDKWMQPVHVATMFYTEDHEPVPGIEDIGIGFIGAGWDPE